MLAGLAAACNRVGTPIDMAHPPQTKAGLWTETGVLHGQPHAPFTFCDPGRAIFPPKDASCSQWEARRMPGGDFLFEATCSKDGAVVRLHRHVVGDLATGFTDDITSTMDAPNEPRSTLSAHAELHYKGACPPGMQTFNPTAG
jgi:hypothetical protein